MQALEAEKADIAARLDDLRAGKAKKVTKMEREEVEREWKKWRTAARRREKISGELWKLIEGLVEKGERAEVRESLGLDE